ncbi:IS5 family transposase [Chromobacterium sp. IIBBL 290-4]|uniref:IS5 family transposase n=1 Tax=Chromobacterium sp. IIBBL 290-4 TaxID=2953890 RepID=UPI0020B7378B|nr:IS5 family transposase [Chromobacterium sp. IIBBL 290-4]UTH73052.1 IS5 family transposase [Chromobacterium sp. IIBBL 290-4]UTH73388.1 IS5 family transposase [Chromobacterium sp. IIBBL 290-4]UTH73566.1 IS5 family transposase [Chromobacterium sp. IIBBL 290-4]UTH73719.1 IS5 family transposase [Chromobacterium sp. IIBBL 290-4]UTH73796.1 IS5 family transposase [Chromobacterium sp. IIBBL 290-4]
MSKPAPPKYKTTNWKTYNAALKARGSLMIWLDRDMRWHGSAVGKRGRTPTFSDAAIQFCLTIKCLFNLALRQAVGMVQSLLKLAGLDWLTPDYSTVCRRQKHLQVAIPCRPTTTGLHLLIDSTGIKMLGEGEWKTKKHGAEYRRQWRKVHLGIDAQTLEIRAIEVTDNAVGDAPMLPELLDQISAGERIAAVSGDGAYDTKGCHEAIAKRKAEAVIPTRKNAKPWKENRLGAHVRNEILRATRLLGRAIWRKWSGYHRRSLVETKMRCFKLLGERVMARDFDRQVAELQVRAAILNRFTRLGTPMTVRMP